MVRGQSLDYAVPRYVNFVDSLPKTRPADRFVLCLLSLLASRQRRRDRLRHRDGLHGARRFWSTEAEGAVRLSPKASLNMESLMLEVDARPGQSEHLALADSTASVR
jgi:hypothetical protein